ncbi:MAG: hypothetical protein E3J72_00935 [Planctomycetota bacterium]|nr:MAG: hypothetical protein E3J72_00935 [Planctomycetota bacterium]
MAKAKKKKKASKASAKKQAKAAKAKTGKPKGAAAPAQKKKKASPAELTTLKKPAEEAKAKLENAKTEADTLRKKASDLEAAAKNAYREAVAPYREACRKADVECEFAGGKANSVTERVGFLVEKANGGIRVMIKSRPKTEEVIPLKVLKESIGKAAYAYTDKHLGPREKIGNKGGSLSNRLRDILV